MENKEDIIEGLKNGDEKAYKDLFYNYFQPLTYFAHKYLKDIDLSKDLVQGVFTQIYEKRTELNINSSLKSYLFQSVANRSINQLKSEKIHSRHHEDIKHGMEDSYQDDQLETYELEAKINRIVNNLPGQCQRIFKLSRFEHKSNQEIADELGLSKRTVETQISKALKVLRRSLAVLILEFAVRFFD